MGNSCTRWVQGVGGEYKGYKVGPRGMKWL